MYRRILPPRKRRGDLRRVGAEEAREPEGPDLISRLPDCVLGAVVSLLDPEDGARTALLSRRWRHIWRSAPLNLDDRLRFLYNDSERLQVISQILAAHGGPTRRLALTALRIPSSVLRYDDFLTRPVFDSLTELVIHCPLRADYPKLPASALRFASLRLMDLSNCTFPDGGCAPAFPCLTSLFLYHVVITADLIETMISNSPGIEYLWLDTNFGHRKICLSLPKLRYLAVLVEYFRKSELIELEDLVIRDAACLERLLLHEVDHGPSVRVTGATKLQMLGYLGTGFPVIEIGNSVFKAMVPFSLAEQLSTVKILALEMPDPKLKVLIGYLICFPCLETLHIKFCVNVWMHLKPSVNSNSAEPIKCLDHSLRTIVLKSYEGLKKHIEFAKFFVERARVLDIMKFCISKKFTPIWLQRQHKLLKLKNRASRKAKFPFVDEYELPIRFFMDDGFSKDDPFIGSR